MARSLRVEVGGEVYHCLNRSVCRHTIFHKPEDYQLFENILEEVCDITTVDILGYTVMSNHWHLVIRPKNDGDLSNFMKRLTVTHTQRHRVKTHTIGEGPVYQGRYKSFLVQEDQHLLTVLRYVERNPLTAKLVTTATDWKYSSLYRRYKGTVDEQRILTPWPTVEPSQYLQLLQQPLTPKEYEKISLARDKGVPFGSDTYVLDMVERHNLQSTQRERGRPKQG